MPELSLDLLRRYAIARTLFAPTTLARAIPKIGFLQADPIRAPARAQDLILRHRVENYRARDLERRYSELDIEEGFFINYGFLSRASYALMHPRSGFRHTWDVTTKKQTAALLRFVKKHGSVHPQQVEAHFGLGSVTNYWGGSSRAGTHLLDKMHYRGLLRVVGREGGVRIYATQGRSHPARTTKEKQARLDRLVDLIVHTYAPLPLQSLKQLVRSLKVAVPQWQADLESAVNRAEARLAHGTCAGTEWFWPADEKLSSARTFANEGLRMLAPFDPLVWDRRRFEMLWGWAYRFEAYTPAAKRKLGYYALPMLWRDEMIGWANVGQKDGTLAVDLGFVAELPMDSVFVRDLEAESTDLQRCLERSP